MPARPPRWLCALPRKPARAQLGLHLKRADFVRESPARFRAGLLVSQDCQTVNAGAIIASG
jgi:hypothetical protein